MTCFVQNNVRPTSGNNNDRRRMFNRNIFVYTLSLAVVAPYIAAVS